MSDKSSHESGFFCFGYTYEKIETKSMSDWLHSGNIADMGKKCG